MVIVSIAQEITIIFMSVYLDSLPFNDFSLVHFHFAFILVFIGIKARHSGALAKC